MSALALPANSKSVNNLVFIFSSCHRVLNSRLRPLICKSIAIRSAMKTKAVPGFRLAAVHRHGGFGPRPAEPVSGGVPL
jgi:hypothetical protein